MTKSMNVMEIKGRQADQEQRERDRIAYCGVAKSYNALKTTYLDWCVWDVRSCMRENRTQAEQAELRNAWDTLKAEIVALPKAKQEEARNMLMAFGMPIFPGHGEEDRPFQWKGAKTVMDELYEGLVQDIPDRDTWEGMSHAAKGIFLAKKHWGLYGIDIDEIDRVTYAFWSKSVDDMLEVGMPGNPWGMEGDTWDTAMLHEAIQKVRSISKETTTTEIRRQDHDREHHLGLLLRRAQLLSNNAEGFSGDNQG